MPRVKRALEVRKWMRGLVLSTISPRCKLFKVKLLKSKSTQTQTRRAAIPVTRMYQNSTYIIPAEPAQPQQPKNHWLVLLPLVLLIIAVVAGMKFVESRANNQRAQDFPIANFNKTQNSVNDPNSIWVIVNKGRELPGNYVPPDLVVPNVPLRLDSADPEMQLRKTAADALAQMFAGAKAQNIDLMLLSGYRSFTEQTGIYNNFVGVQGQQNTDATSAKPGHSEHQLGLAADVEPTSRNCEAEPCFASTPEGQWIAANAYKYGFIIRYQSGKENLTGYAYESWHVRYVGIPLAAQIHKTGQTLEQFFGLSVVTDYPANPYQLKVGS